MSVNPDFSTTEGGESVVGASYPEEDEYFEEFKQPSSMVLPPSPTMPLPTTETSFSPSAKTQTAPQDGLAVILRDHDFIREIMRKYEFEASTLEDRMKCVQVLTSAICQHMYIEEHLVYPILRSRIQEGEFIYERLMLDDLQTKEFLMLAEKFSPSVNNRVEYDKLISKLIKHELEHIQEEEDVLIPLLEQVMSFQELDTLCKHMVMLKVTAPKHPKLIPSDFTFGIPINQQSGTGQKEETAAMGRPVKFFYATKEGEVRESNGTILTGTVASAALTKPKGIATTTGPLIQDQKSILKHLSVASLVGDRHYASALARIGIHSIWELIHHCKTTGDTFSVHQQTGITLEAMVKFVHRADLMRIRGVGLETSELLVEAGVKSVRDLAHRNLKDLALELQMVNEKLNLLPKLSTTSIQNWIVEASFLPAIVEVY